MTVKWTSKWRARARVLTSLESVVTSICREDCEGKQCNCQLDDCH